MPVKSVVQTHHVSRVHALDENLRHPVRVAFTPVADLTIEEKDIVTHEEQAEAGGDDSPPRREVEKADDCARLRLWRRPVPDAVVRLRGRTERTGVPMCDSRRRRQLPPCDGTGSVAWRLLAQHIDLSS
jgi:hypothetical protein